MTKKYSSFIRLGAFSILLLGICVLLASHKNNIQEKLRKNTISAETLMKLKSEKSALDSARILKKWLETNGYCSSYIFLADLKLPMDVKRFYVINIDSNKIVNRFIVAHGSGLGSNNDSVVFSNAPGSLCTSAGKYALGKELYGEYGKGYWLDGLEKTNNNARKRFIVFHYFLLQTTQEHAEHNYFSFGCPMIAKSSFDYCDTLISRESKKMVMYIYQ